MSVNFFSKSINLKIVVLFLLLIGIVGGVGIWFYQLLRWIVFAVSIYFAYKLYESKKNIDFWIIAFSVSAFLFNPLVPFYFGRELWVLIDMATFVFYLISLKKNNLNKGL